MATAYTHNTRYRRPAQRKLPGAYRFPPSVLIPSWHWRTMDPTDKIQLERDEQLRSMFVTRELSAFIKDTDALAQPESMTPVLVRKVPLRTISHIQRHTSAALETTSSGAPYMAIRTGLEDETWKWRVKTLPPLPPDGPAEVEELPIQQGVGSPPRPSTKPVSHDWSLWSPFPPQPHGENQQRRSSAPSAPSKPFILRHPLSGPPSRGLPDVPVEASAIPKPLKSLERHPSRGSRRSRALTPDLATGVGPNASGLGRLSLIEETAGCDESRRGGTEDDVRHNSTEHIVMQVAQAMENLAMSDSEDSGDELDGSTATSPLVPCLLPPDLESRHDSWGGLSGLAGTREMHTTAEKRRSREHDALQGLRQTRKERVRLRKRRDMEAVATKMQNKQPRRCQKKPSVEEVTRLGGDADEVEDLMLFPSPPQGTVFRASVDQRSASAASDATEYDPNMRTASPVPASKTASHVSATFPANCMGFPPFDGFSGSPTPPQTPTQPSSRPASQQPHRSWPGTAATVPPFFPGHFPIQEHIDEATLAYRQVLLASIQALQGTLQRLHQDLEKANLQRLPKELEEAKMEIHALKRKQMLDSKRLHETTSMVKVILPIVVPSEAGGSRASSRLSSHGRHSAQYMGGCVATALSRQSSFHSVASARGVGGGMDPLDEDEEATAPNQMLNAGPLVVSSQTFGLYHHAPRASPAGPPSHIHEIQRSQVPEDEDSHVPLKQSTPQLPEDEPQLALRASPGCVRTRRGSPFPSLDLGAGNVPLPKSHKAPPPSTDLKATYFDPARKSAPASSESLPQPAPWPLPMNGEQQTLSLPMSTFNGNKGCVEDQALFFRPQGQALHQDCRLRPASCHSDQFGYEEILRRP